MSVSLGAMIPKLHCDQLSRHEVRTFLAELNSNALFREACLTIGMLASDVPEHERRERAKVCFELLLATTDPPGPPAKSDAVNRLRADFTMQFQTRPFCGTWEAHVGAPPGKWSKSKTSVIVSDELRERIAAIEALWGVKNCMLFP